MQILAIQIEGLRDLPKCRLSELQNNVQFQGPNPVSSAIADALSFWFAALRKEDMAELFRQWGWADDDLEVIGEEGPEQLFWENGLLPSLWVGENRSFSIVLTIALNAQQIGKIRQSTQDPDILLALMERPQFKMTVSGLFTRQFCGLALSKSDMFIGEYEVPLERPYWLRSVLRTFEGKFFRNYDHFSVPDQALTCALSVHHFPAYQAFQQAVQEIGQLRVAMSEQQKPMLLIDDRPMQRWGWSLTQHLRALASVYLFAADIVWVDNWFGVGPEKVQVLSTTPKGNTIVELHNPQRSIQFPER